MKNITSVRKILILSLIIVFAIAGLILYANFSIDQKTNLLSSNIQEKITRLVELSTVKYNYTNIVEYEDKKQLSGVDIPFTIKKFILKYSGYIKAGIDLNTIEIDMKDKDTIEVTMNNAEIFENVISEEDVYFYDERDSIFNKLSFEDLYTVLIEEKEKMKKEVLDKGILNDAENNGGEIIKSLLEGMGFENISIKYR
ncbi:DUF4230 domain-containing protein [Tissierella sp.]|uniref:DUF4230 domain-containing protein n=1 Tax=Tissierella sp. TaxID=41274 RepID=UPI00286076FD|nr:DUF4230 domain-containing protein [Tissierella sp.]MDR7857682.1 DUF4230 domain-containing protein [Tissierella sp.]